MMSHVTLSRILMGSATALGSFIALGTVAALWDNPFFVRMTPVSGFETAALAALEGQLRGLFAVVADDRPDEAIETIKSFERALGAVAGVSSIRSKLSRTRRALKGDTPDREKAAAELGQALELYTSEVAWRRQAQTQLAAGLEEYDNAIKDTIGARSQERVSSEQAGAMVGCLSLHRDISLSF